MVATGDEWGAGLAEVRRAPRSGGRLELIVRRPAVGEREVLDTGVLDPEVGLVGDGWLRRGSRRTADGSAHPDMQLNVMSARAAALIAGPRVRWPLAGDQLYVDFDLSEDSVGPGTRLAIGVAVIEITDQPHLGCAKFAARFGREALRGVNSPVGVSLRLRGVNARVVEGGPIVTGDSVARVAAGRARGDRSARPEADGLRLRGGVPTGPPARESSSGRAAGGNHQGV